MRNKGNSARHAISARQKLSSVELQQLKNAFDLFDEQHSGSIDPLQIHKILEELGLDHRNEVVFQMMNDMESKNRPITFDQFVEIIYGRLGDTRSKDGLQRVFALYDYDGTGFIDLQKIKHVSKELGDNMNDEELLEMMHNTHILNKTESNEGFTFEEFYQIVTRKKY